MNARMLITIAILISLFAGGALAQGQPANPAQSMLINPESTNPMSILANAGTMLPGQGQGEVSQDGPADGGGLSAAINIMILLSVVTLVPSILLMTTSFVRILVVLGLMRQAIGTQSLPPPQVITGLAMFMTLLVMAPTFDRIYDEALDPYQRGEIRDYDTLWNNAKQPMRDFMFDQIEATGNWSSVYMLLEYRGVDTTMPGEMTRSDVDMTVLVPAYMLSELKVGFLMGFRVYLPFLVIDMVIASILISMSMMMLPPVLISLPFKLLLFVLVDGWTLVVGSLLESFVQDGMSSRISAQAAVLPVLLIPIAVRGARDRFPVRGEPAALPCLIKETHRCAPGLLGGGR